MEDYNQAGASFPFVKKERRGRRAELPDDVAKKLKSCSVLGCEEWRDLTSHTTYHWYCFPTGDKNQQRWEIWTSLLQKAREDNTWIPFRGSLVCSYHFRPEDFVQDPNQKRTKLVKTAIPSIFPTFQVDLEDPNFVLDDSTELEGETENNEGYSYYEEYNEGDAGYGYEYEQEEDQEIEDPEMVIPEVQFNDEEVEEDDNEPDLQYATYRQHPQQVSQTVRSRPLPMLTPATSGRKSHEMYAIDTEPPRKKIAVGVSGGVMANKPQLTFKGAIASTAVRSNGAASSHNVSRSSKLYEQLCKSTSNTKYQIPWNSDLEIEEVMENNSDDSGWKERAEELEYEKGILQQKYEAQIRALQRKVKEQDRRINDYAAQINSLNRQINLS